MKNVKVIYYEAYDGYAFATLLEKSCTVTLEKNCIREWREITRQKPINHGAEKYAKIFQQQKRENEVFDNIVTINPGLRSNKILLIF